MYPLGVYTSEILLFTGMIGVLIMLTPAIVDKFTRPRK